MAIATPIRIMPGGLQMPRGNAALDGYYRDRQDSRQEAEEGRRVSDQAEVERQRQVERDTEAMIRKSLQESEETPESDVFSDPATSPAPSGRLSTVSSEPLPAQPASAPAPAQRATSLSSVSTAPKAAATAPAQTDSGLGAVSSEMPMEEISVNSSRGGAPGNRRAGALGRINSLEGSLSRNLMQVNPREVLKYRQSTHARSLKEIEDENAKELEVLKMAHAGDVEGATMLARQYGIDVDPQVLSNGELREAGIYAAETAKSVGADHDEAWIQRFAENFLQTRDARAALKAAGQPSKRPAKPGTYRPTTTIKGGKAYAGAFNTTDGTTTVGDQEVPMPGRAGGGGSAGKEVAMMDFLVSKGIVDGATEQEKYRAAAKWVQTAKSNPNARTNMMVQAASRMAANDAFARNATRAGKDPMTEAMAQVQSAVAAAEGGSDPQFFDLPDGKRVFTTDGRTYYYADGTGQYEGEFESESPSEDENE